MAEAEQPKSGKNLLFEGKKLGCEEELWSGDFFLHCGHWKCFNYANPRGEGWQKTEMKNVAVIRKIKNEECHDDWKVNALKLIKLDHLNVLRVFDYEEDVDNGLRFFALEPFSATLFHYCNRMYNGPMPNESQVLYQITSGINHLHTKGIIVHGDLNPLSVVIAAHSRPVRMKIADSGLSKKSYSEQLNESRPDLCQTKYGTQWKQIYQNSKHVADDTVAVGCILFYYLKRGGHLFGDDSESILKNLKDKNPVNLEKLNKNHIAYKLIQDMIIPPSNGLNGLSIAINKFQEALSLKVDLNKFLGVGSFGEVYGGMFEGDPVAVKQMTVTTSEKDIIQREMKKHIKLDHVNVVKLLEVSDCPDHKFTHMVLELCAGTLKDCCEKKYKGPMPPDELVLYQIANGLHYIHSRNLVHRDIKPDNILISMTKPVQMKVSDLSFVKKTKLDQFSQSVICGALLWMAPERLKWSTNASGNLPYGTIKSDTFSSGCVFFYYLTRGKHPFGNNVNAPANIEQNKPVEFDNYVKDSTTDNKISEILADVIKGMIKGNEEKRTGLPEVIKQLVTLLSRIDQIKCQLREVNVPLDEADYYISSFHPTKAILAYANREKEFIFFTAENSSIPFSNWRKEIKLPSRDLNRTNVTALEWNMNGTQLAVRYNYDTLVVWNYPECEILLQKKHSADIAEIEWNPTRPNVLATFHLGEKNVFLWDSSTGDVITTIDTEDHVDSVKWISGNRIAVSSKGVINIFEMGESHSTTTTRIVKQFPHGKECGTEMEWNERTQYLASCEDHEIKIWSMDSDEPIYSLKAEQLIDRFAWRPCVRNENQLDGIEMARKSPENFNIVYGTYNDLSHGGCINIWNPLKNEQKPRLLYSDKHQIDFITFSYDGRFFATGFADKLIIWSAEEWKPIYIRHKKISYGADGFSWLSSTTSTNIFENKLIKKSLFHEIPELIEFTFEESESSAKSEEDYMDLK